MGTFNSRPRRLALLGAASLLALAALAPAANAADPLTGAIWTSLSNGDTVNANLYDNKADVYLNGGPQNCGGGSGLPDGDYFFEVVDPSGATLLSTDAIKYRQIQVVGGKIDGVSGDGNHAEGSNNSCTGVTPVQLIPYADTPNNGGEYKVIIGRVSEIEGCDGFDADSTSFIFNGCSDVNQKSDNYKVGEEATPTPEQSATPTPEQSATPTPEQSATPTPQGSVGEETDSPTLPPTDMVSGTSGGAGSLGLVLAVLAGVMATALVMTPARARRRR